MNIVLNIKDFNIDNIQLLDKKNNIVMEGNFTKLIYSDPFITMSGLYIYFQIHIKSVFKNTAFFYYNENKECIHEILEIEKNILQYYKEISNTHTIKPLVFSSIKKQFMTGVIKLNSFTNGQFEDSHPFSEVNKPSTIFHEDYKCLLKISGIWENNGTIGITYKILQSKQ